jgi:hypothetical protein
MKKRSQKRQGRTLLSNSPMGSCGRHLNQNKNIAENKVHKIQMKTMDAGSEIFVIDIRYLSIYFFNMFFFYLQVGILNVMLTNIPT